MACRRRTCLAGWTAGKVLAGYFAFRVNGDPCEQLAAGAFISIIKFKHVGVSGQDPGYAHVARRASGNELYFRAAASTNVEERIARVGCVPCEPLAFCIRRQERPDLAQNNRTAGES